MIGLRSTAVAQIDANRFQPTRVHARLRNHWRKGVRRTMPRLRFNRLAPLLLVLVFAVAANAELILTGLLPRRAEPYSYSETVKVPFTRVLRVDAGTHLCFEEGASLLVEGTLIADGTAELPIVLSPCSSDGRWSGVSFDGAGRGQDGANRLTHVVIERAEKLSNANEEAGAGGGVSVVTSDLVIENSTIRANRATRGGGLYVGRDSKVTVSGALIDSNTATGSNYVFTGGGGIYIDGPSAFTMMRSVVATSSFRGNNYENEEGGGGIYYASGKATLGFNLIIGNESGKAPGMLVNTVGASRAGDFRPVGNLFLYNFGARNFEQVVLQTRETFEDLAFTEEWARNAGQFPFVVWLTRNRFARVIDNGDRRAIAALRNGDRREKDFSRLLTDKIPLDELGELSSLSSSGWKVCGAALDLGPVELCDATSGTGVDSYLAAVGAEMKAPDLTQVLTELVFDEKARRGNRRLLDHAAPAEREGAAPSAFSDIVFGDQLQRQTALKGIASPIELVGDSRDYLPAVWLYAIGDDDAFVELTRREGAAMRVFENAALRGFSAAAQRALDAAGGVREAPDPKPMYRALQTAAEAGFVDLVDRILDAKIDPNVSIDHHYPLEVAVRGNQLDVVQLLLRRGARPDIQIDALNGNGKVPLLFAGAEWLHLGGGHREMPLMLLAAGADFPDSATFDQYSPSPWFLTNVLRLGYGAGRDLGQELARTNDSGGGGNFVLPDLRAGRVSVDPDAEAIRRMRSQSNAALFAALETDDATNAAGALRVLSVRDLQLSPQSRSQLVTYYSRRPEGRSHSEPSLDDVLANLKAAPLRSGGDEGELKGGGAGKALAKPEPILPYGEKWLIAIGVSDYMNLPAKSDAGPDYEGLVDLRFADSDATRLRDFVVASGRMGKGWKDSLLTQSDATLVNVRARLAELKSQVRKEDLVVFFFSGHGAVDQDESEKPYLMVRDSKVGDLRSSALSMRELREWVIGLRSDHVIVLLDACRSGQLGVAKGDHSDFNYDSLEGGQAAQELGKVAITSSLGRDSSYEWPTMKSGVFTYHLLGALSERTHRSKHGRFITVEDVWVSLSEDVPKARLSEQGRTQRPNLILLDGSAGKDIPIALSGGL